MNQSVPKLPVAKVLCHQLVGIALGNYEGPGSPEDALALIERIVELSEFDAEDMQLIQLDLKMVREGLPKPATVHQLKRKQKLKFPNNPYNVMLGIPEPAHV